MTVLAECGLGRVSSPRSHAGAVPTCIGRHSMRRFIFKELTTWLHGLGAS